MTTTNQPTNRPTNPSKERNEPPLFGVVPMLLLLDDLIMPDEPSAFWGVPACLTGRQHVCRRWNGVRSVRAQAHRLVSVCRTTTDTLWQCVLTARRLTDVSVRARSCVRVLRCVALCCVVLCARVCCVCTRARARVCVWAVGMVFSGTQLLVPFSSWSWMHRPETQKSKRKSCP